MQFQENTGLLWALLLPLPLLSARNLARTWAWNEENYLSRYHSLNELLLEKLKIILAKKETNQDVGWIYKQGNRSSLQTCRCVSPHTQTCKMSYCTWNLHTSSTEEKIQFLSFLSQVGNYWNIVFSLPSLRKYRWPSIFVPPAVLGEYSPQRSLNPVVTWISWKPLEFFSYPVFTIMEYSTTEAEPSLKKCLGSSSRQKQANYAFQLLWDTKKFSLLFHY